MLRLILSCLLGISVGLCQTYVAAQDAPRSIGSPEKTTETIIRQTPQIVIVDPNGNWLLPLRGEWTPAIIDVFLDFLRGTQQQSAPPFIIRNINATGTVAENYAETNVRIDFATFGSQTVQIPLALKEGILPDNALTNTPAFRYTGPGVASLTVDAEGQYLALITPRTSESPELDKPEQAEHTVSLLLWVPFVQNDSGEKRLALSFPQSNSSQFLLEVPMTNIDASVSHGFIFGTQENAGRQSTLLRIHGLRADTEISWQKRVIEVADDLPVLLVEKAAIDVKLDAVTRSAVYDAVLPISSVTGSFEQLHIRLPLGSVLDKDWADRYAVAGNYVVEETTEDSVVTVRFAQKTTGPVSIHLRAEQQFAGDTSDFRHELAGFEVLGAERQSGSLSVSVTPADMRPYWEPILGIGRTEGVSSNAGSSGDTRFEFISQPFSLRVRVAAPQIRINVKPRYYYSISRGEITMAVRLHYTVSGSKVNELYLHFPDAPWNWDFSTASLVDVAGVDWDESGNLKIPLLRAQEGSFELEFRVHRTLDVVVGSRHRLTLPIPRPEGVAWRESADVVIASMYNVEVLPIDLETRALTRLTRREAQSVRLDTSDTQQEPLYYRTELPDAVFVADLILQQPKVSATMRTDVRLFEESPRVEQTISYNAAFTLVDRIFLLLPRTLEASNDVQVRLGNRTLELRHTIADPLVSVPDNYVRKMVQLPEPVSRLELTFLYSPPPLAVTDENTVPYSFPFICPADVPVTEHRIHFFTPSNYRVELQNESKPLWESFREPRRSSMSASETFRSALSPMRIALFVSAPEKNVSGTTIVERAWLQTWLFGTIRVDRAAYRVKSTNDSVTLQLPRDSTRDNPVGVQVDGQPIPPNISPTGLLTIPISPEQYNRPIEISVDYRYSFKMSEMRVPITLPSFAKEDLVLYKFWQIILPQNQHIIGGPKGWSLVYDWSWNGLFWWRTPSIRKSDIGFTPDSQDVEKSISESSQYVFTHLQPPRDVRLYVVNRSTIILFSSSVALFIGLVLIYVPQSRYAGSLFGLGVGLLAVLFYQPSLVLLMFQAAVFGVFLALGAGYMYRIFHRQRDWIPPTYMMTEDLSQPSPTPLPPSPSPSQVVHEVIIDESGSKEPSVINN